ncbi:MAG: ribonuclease HI family protein [Parcubacteria group bacterium]|nr:ribonuclease HI family protein [Parcubacteria group bacterium]MCR4342960.1 ribonuclease HI family protein [Patescibacteria group bacterium]
MKQDKIVIYTDGGSRGNPGPAGVGVVIVDSQGKVLKEYSSDIGVRTNNEAEYEAIILALSKVKHLFGKEKTKNLEIEIRTDSQLIARQLKGEYKLNEEKLFPLFIKIWNLKTELGKISFVEIPREKNKEADRLANEAMDKKKTLF